MRLSFEHKAHPHISDRQSKGPTKVKDSAGGGFNGKLAVILTSAVGTMWCAYFFAILALIALPDALKGGLMPTIMWISQTFIQLVMLSVIMVGQQILGKASDVRSELTYKDAEATFHEAQQIQSHLAQQDEALNNLLDRMEKFEAGKSKGS